MKALALFLLAVLFSTLGISQGQYEAIEIIKPRKISLNGGARSEFGGKSRVTIKIDLPPNTVEWFYAFSCVKGESGTQNLNLLPQLVSTVSTGGLLSGISSGLRVPQGTGTADIYLLPAEYERTFANKADNSGAQLKCYQEGTIFNHKSAVVEIDDANTGTLFLGLKNPSTWDAITISIEVVAIVRKVDEEKAVNQSKAEMYGNLGWKFFEKGELTKAIEMTDKSLELLPLGWVKANCALFQLAKSSDTAVDEYLEAIMLIKNQPNSRVYLIAALQDIDRIKISESMQASAEVIVEMIALELQQLKK